MLTLRGIRTHDSALERAKTFHALDRATTVIGAAQPVIVKSSAQILNCLVLLKILPRGLISILLVTLYGPILNINVDRISPCLIKYSVLKVPYNVFCNFTFLYVLENVIFVREINIAVAYNFFFSSIF
jgi:hypothetical protein